MLSIGELIAQCHELGTCFPLSSKLNLLALIKILFDQLRCKSCSAKSERAPFPVESPGNEAEGVPVLDSWIKGSVMVESVVGCLSFAWKFRVSLNARKNGALTEGCRVASNKRKTEH